MSLYLVIQNDLIEKLNGILREECLNLEWFESLEHLNDELQEWSYVYNHLSPHGSIQYQIPFKPQPLNPNLYFSIVAALEKSISLSI